jgi:hypothetical protein
MRNEERSTGAEEGGGETYKAHSHENETFLINVEEIEFFTCFKAMLIGISSFSS